MEETELSKLLDKLIDASPEDVASLQLQIGSLSYAGAVRRSVQHEGLFEMIAVDPQQRVAVSIFFMPSALTAVFVPKDSSILTPKKSSIITPGH